MLGAGGGCRGAAGAHGAGAQVLGRLQSEHSGRASGAHRARTRVVGPWGVAVRRGRARGAVGEGRSRVEWSGAGRPAAARWALPNTVHGVARRLGARAGG